MHLYPCTCPTNCHLHDKVLLMLHGHVIADHSYAGWGLIWVMGALGAVLHEFLTTSYQFYDIIIWSATRWEVCIWRCNTLLCWIVCLMPKVYTQLVSRANLNSFAILMLKVFPEIIRVEDWWISLRHLFQFFWYVKSEKLVLKLLQHLKRFSEGTNLRWWQHEVGGGKDEGVGCAFSPRLQDNSTDWSSGYDNCAITFTRGLWLQTPCCNLGQVSWGKSCQSFHFFDIPLISACLQHGKSDFVMQAGSSLLVFLWDLGWFYFAVLPSWKHYHVWWFEAEFCDESTKWACHQAIQKGSFESCHRPRTVGAHWLPTGHIYIGWSE